MKNRPRARQLRLFPGECPTWEMWPGDLRQAVTEVLSQWLEQALGQPPYERASDPPPLTPENCDV